MFAMFTRLFAMFETLFAAGEKGAKALDHLASWSEDTAGAFNDEAKIQRIAKRKALLAKAGVSDEEVAKLEAEKAPVVQD